MTTDHAREYCDWCSAPLSDESRTRSRWLGLTSEDVWACADCLRTGHYRTPPESWLGDGEEWLARDQYILAADDIVAVVNALNEVLNGPDSIENWEFSTRIGVSVEEALQLLDRISGRPG
ncbi:hypothetical protein [Microbacterium sp. P03]|uniref:hypothetical protein n=1 Tax=Microbacterium sp. P03 TaxID=3366946 RepID=UPI0037452271